MRPLAALLFAASFFVATTDGAEIEVITPKSDPIQCKETDWIYGDYYLQNDTITAVIAQPVKGRNANMTVRGVGACVIDLTLNSKPNDQLSCYYPTGGRFQFEDPKKVRFGTLDAKNGEVVSDAAKQSGKGVFLEIVSSSAAKGKLEATIRYELRDGESFLRTSVAVKSLTDEPLEFEPYDGIRADKTFRFENLSDNVAFAEDSFFGQTYGMVLPTNEGKLTWKSGRMRVLSYDDAAVTHPSPKELDWEVYLTPATCITDLWAEAGQIRNPKMSATPQVLTLFDEGAPVDHAQIQVKSTEGIKLPQDTIITRGDGSAIVRLPDGEYVASISAIGYPDTTEALSASAQTKTHQVKLPVPAFVMAKVTDVKGKKIPCKATFYGVGETKDPDFGPDSGSDSIKNCVYSIDGVFRRTLDPGTYDVVISHGPEYDAVFRKIEVSAGQETKLKATLKRTVNTPGWVSTELHSHSTPSGDNTSTQRGRVQNLVCEQLEFAPCTEHNRIDSYTPLLKEFGVEHLMATCTGMELTGSPLPVNHQNAFPLHHHPHTQDGGGPVTDANPVAQIERLAMWDDGAEKVVQGNHPNIRQQFGDRDTDGKTDEGFRAMFGFMDVIEVHPPEAIFQGYDQPDSIKDNRMVQWMQLLNQGHRIPGVVNTDAHYNHHGSGWLRNWFESSTDDPAKISTPEMVHAAEHGHIIMSTGPYMTVEMTTTHDGKKQSGTAGDDLVADDGKCQVAIQVQCPNWLDVNRVQIFLNGRSTDELNFTRRKNPEMFSNDVIKFEQTIPVNLTEDTHVIVAAIGEDMKLGRVMGEDFGKNPPCVVANPVWIDVDGNGFKPNYDGLGLPLPGAKEPATEKAAK